MRLCTIFFFSFVVLLFSACSKTEIQVVNQPYLIEGNEPPDYSGVTNLQVRQYVSRLYIDLLGEQPLTAVMDEKVAYLQSNDLSPVARNTLVQELMDDEAYASNIFNYTASQFLNGVARSEIQDQIDLYAFLIVQYTGLGEIQVAQVLEYEQQKLVLLINASEALQSGAIDISAFYQRFCFNEIYDEINMGSENMVISCFENLFGRLPTNNELTSGVQMVEGLSAVLLQENGNSKLNFVEIVTQTSEFYLGRVFEQYQRLLVRTPTPLEEYEGALQLKNEGLRAFQSTILISDEYAAF
jgi:hypothetical protein